MISKRSFVFVACLQFFNEYSNHENPYLQFPRTLHSILSSHILTPSFHSLPPYISLWSPRGHLSPLVSQWILKPWKFIPSVFLEHLTLLSPPSPHPSFHSLPPYISLWSPRGHLHACLVFGGIPSIPLTADAISSRMHCPHWNFSLMLENNTFLNIMGS